VQDTDWKEDRAGDKKAPETLREAGKDVREPSGPAQ
jgi:hypothetical protein